MKQVTDKSKSIKTIPDGVWESGKPKKTNNKGKSSVTTDLQGNGYPDNKLNK